MKLMKMLFAGALVLSASVVQAQDINFGDDSADYSHDGQCDDRRFEGSGMAVELNWGNVGRDADDCSTAFYKGSISMWNLMDRTANTDCSAIEFGSNQSMYSNDGACDDPRFEGSGAAEAPSSANIGSDADDCSRLCDYGMVFLRDGAAEVAAYEPVEEDAFYGNNSGEYAQDGECDDRRFVGDVMANGLRWDLVGRDADDCREVYEAGLVSLWDQAAAMAQTDCSVIDFGDDSSEYANDGMCDDARFEGRGAAAILVLGYEYGDASDCSRLCNYGTIFVRDVE